MPKKGKSLHFAALDGLTLVFLLLNKEAKKLVHVGYTITCNRMQSKRVFIKNLNLKSSASIYGTNNLYYAIMQQMI
jgi:hypothetical protein